MRHTAAPLLSKRVMKMTEESQIVKLIWLRLEKKNESVLDKHFVPIQDGSSSDWSFLFFLSPKVYITLHISEIIPYSVSVLGAIQRMKQCWDLCCRVTREMYRSYPHGLGQRPSSVIFSLTHWTLSAKSSSQMMLHQPWSIITSKQTSPAKLSNTDPVLDKFWADNYQSPQTTLTQISQWQLLHYHLEWLC